jgi:hypothetical protein
MRRQVCQRRQLITTRPLASVEALTKVSLDSLAW